jgi:vancomycin resistance protein YoaR
VTPGKNFAITFTSIGVLAVLLQASFLFIEKDTGLTVASLVNKKMAAQAQFLNAIKSNFLVFADNKSFEIDSDTLRSWVISNFSDYLQMTEFSIDPEKIKKFLVELPINYGVQAVNGKLGVNEEGLISESIQSRNGRILNIEQSSKNIISNLQNGTSWANLVFDEIPAKVSSSRIQNLGINSLLGIGETNFAGSSASRIQNIRTGAAVYNGLVITPGEEFSFNDLLGSVDETSGYKSELVLKDHQIMPEFGGGLCQVSSTLFRAITNAGLKITERHGHTLSLKYYAPPGFDATIYPGVSDFKFINDTDHNILLQSEVGGNIIKFYVFGVNDQRKIKLEGPRIYEHGEGGATKTILTRTVIFADGKQKKDTFYSDYKDPSLYPLVKNPLE